MERRKIFVLLTQLPDPAARLLRFFTFFPYTHASLGLEEDMNTFYSFNYKGFFVEKITRYLKPGRKPFPCALYEMEVSQEVYRVVRQMIAGFERRKAAFRYTRLGVILSVLHIPNQRRDRYFCSHFVAEVLQRTKAARLKKHCTLYLPGDFRKLEELRLVFQGDMKRLANRYLALPEGLT